MENKTKVVGYTSEGKIFVYKWSEQEVAQFVSTFETEAEEIYFLLTEEEISEYLREVPKDNLKNDFIWFKPGVNRKHQMICTCEKFLEAGDDMEHLAKLALRHHKRTGHTLHPRGN